MAARTVDYRWRLAELMAAAGLHNSTDLVPLLRERGIDLSASQIYRLVAGQPEKGIAPGHGGDMRCLRLYPRRSCDGDGHRCPTPQDRHRQCCRPQPHRTAQTSAGDP